MNPVGCSLIWPARSPMAPIASPGSARSVTGLSTARWRRAPPRGGWSIPAWTPRTCPTSRPPGRMRGRRRGRQGRHRVPVAGCTSIWTPRSASIIPTTRRAAATWKHTFGFHPLLAFLDRPDIAAGEALAGLLRPGNAGSNTAADHVTVLGMALAQLPPAYRPRPADPDSPKILIRTDSAGGTHVFAKACRAAGVGYSFGVPVIAPVKHAVELLEDSNG